jgi:hypothetical protein
MQLAPNRPSKRHCWQFLRWTALTRAVERCDRCGAHFVENADTTGPRNCFPKPQWLAEHPEDDGGTF